MVVMDTGASLARTHFEREPALSKRSDGQPAGRERRVGLIVAAPAEGDEAIEVEMGAALRPPDDMMDIEPTTAAAGLPASPGAGRDFGRESLGRNWVRFVFSLYPSIARVQV
jgi:hypothetical protein